MGGGRNSCHLQLGPDASQRRFGGPAKDAVSGSRLALQGQALPARACWGLRSEVSPNIHSTIPPPHHSWPGVGSSFQRTVREAGAQLSPSVVRTCLAGSLVLASTEPALLPLSRCNPLMPFNPISAPCGCFQLWMPSERGLVPNQRVGRRRICPLSVVSAALWKGMGGGCSGVGGGGLLRFIIVPWCGEPNDINTQDVPERQKKRITAHQAKLRRGSHGLP